MGIVFVADKVATISTKIAFKIMEKKINISTASE
jgi:hypothetical protein